jgi:hypothetical protein
VEPRRRGFSYLDSPLALFTHQAVRAEFRAVGADVHLGLKENPSTTVSEPNAERPSLLPQCARCSFHEI